MLEFTINDTVYSFKFGIGFVRELDKTASVEVQHGLREDIGLNYQMAKVYNGDLVALVDVLDLANKYADKPRITKHLLEEFLEDETTDIDEVFKQVLDFFEASNATKGTAKLLKAELEKGQ